MIINVIQDDIDKGVAGDCCCCPIGLAIKRIFSTSRIIRIILKPEAKIIIGYINYQLTKNCQRFISRFDNSEMVHPFHFQLMEVKKEI